MGSRKWPWKINTPCRNDEIEEARKELAEAQEGLATDQTARAVAKIDGKRADRIADRLNHIRTQNHFGEAIERAYRGNHA